MRVLVVAPHPDDEVLGCGGTIPRYVEAGHELHVLIVTKGDDLFDKELVALAREEALRAHEILGVDKTHFADLPAIKLDTLPRHLICDTLASFFRDIRPDTLFLPFAGDINSDHQIVHACSMVAARPTLIPIGSIYCYETLSSTNWNSPGLAPTFTPNVFVDISSTVSLKIDAVKTFRSQLKEHPHERSPESVMALSSYRGGFVNLSHAEAFSCIRQILM
jgi:LmbE family N-acetylglucosaminyl deacetylase